MVITHPYSINRRGTNTMPKEPLKRLVESKSKDRIINAIINATFLRITCRISFNPNHSGLIKEPECHHYCSAATWSVTHYCNSLREALNLLTVEELEIYCHINDLTYEVNGNLTYIPYTHHFKHQYVKYPCDRSDPYFIDREEDIYTPQDGRPFQG